MCTSGVVDDVIFFRNGPAYGAGDESGCTFKLTLTRRQHRCDTEASTQTDSTWGSTEEETESDVYDWLVFALQVQPPAKMIDVLANSR